MPSRRGDCELVLDMLTTPAFREALVRGSGERDGVARGLAELGSAQSRLQTLDDDYYVRGVLAVRRYRSIRVRLEREVERLHTLVDGASRQRLVLHSDPRSLWLEADFGGQRRELVRLIVERVDVMKARRGARFDPSRIRVSVPLAYGLSPSATATAFRHDGVGEGAQWISSGRRTKLSCVDAPTNPDRS